MTTITPKTRISALIKANPDAIEAIAAINEHFKKLRNPILRKILASRVTIAEAAKIGKVDIKVFFERLQPLGFIIQYGSAQKEEHAADQDSKIKYHRYLDVREDISSGADPFKKIMAAVAHLNANETLLLVNSFEPAPLIRILREKNFLISVFEISADEVHTYITKQEGIVLSGELPDSGEFDKVKQQFQEKMQWLDVRSLPMPQPMHAILAALKTLNEGNALFVYHKKVPVFLLPELRDRNFKYVYRLSEDGVNLIIYKEEK